MKHSLTMLRRQGMRWACANALAWGLGNGMVGSPLITYLALALGAQGIVVGAVLAAPLFVGVLRLLAPYFMELAPSRRSFVMACYGGSSLLLALLPWVVMPTSDAQHSAALGRLVALWSAYHVLEYLGTVAFWTWLADLAPVRVRGRFFGRREWYLTVGRMFGMALAGEFVAEFQQRYPSMPAWIGYAFPAVAGALFMFLSTGFLAFMPPLSNSRPAPQVPWRALASALNDRRYWPFLWYTVWFSFFNGISSSAQSVFVAQRLSIELRLRLLFEAVMRAGQMALATETGRWIDRWGNKPVMIVSQLFVAAALGWMFFANAQERWLWPAGTWLFLIAYVGLNVALPNVMLRIAPRHEAAAYVAVAHTLGGLCAGLSILAGGWLFDALEPPRATMPEFVAPLEGLRVWLASWGLNRFQAIFLLAMVLRGCGVFWILPIDDRPPGIAQPAGSPRAKQPP